MNIVEALHGEEAKLHRQLSAIQGAMAALNGGAKSVVSADRIGSPTSTNGKRTKRTMSAAVRARISRKAKARWAKIRAEQSKGKTTK